MYSELHKKWEAGEDVNLAEIAGERFGQDNGEAIVNQKVMDIFVDLQKSLSNDLSCLPGFENTVIRASINEIIRYMTVPLVQNLIHHIMNVQNDDDNEGD